MIDARNQNVLLVKYVSSYTQDVLLNKGFSLVLNVKRPLLNRIARGVGRQVLVAVDWLKDSRRKDHLARRKGCALQVAAEKCHFTIALNMQVPGSSPYSMVLYFVPKKPIPKGSLLNRFIEVDDSYCNSCLKLIPSVPKGSWIVDVDIGSSTVANGVLGLVFGVVTYIISGSEGKGLQVGASNPSAAFGASGKSPLGSTAAPKTVPSERGADRFTHSARILQDQQSIGRTPGMTDMEVAFNAELEEVRNMSEDVDQLMSYIEGRWQGDANETPVAFTKQALEELEQGIHGVPEECKAFRVQLNKNKEAIKDLRDEEMRVDAWRIYVQSIMDQKSDSRYQELWNPRKLHPELEMKRKRLLKADQEFKQHIAELEGHFPLKDSDLDRVGAKVASAFFLIADQHAQDPDAEDATQILRTLAVHRHCGSQMRVIVELLNPEKRTNAIWDDADQGIEIICPEAIRFKLLSRSCHIHGLSTFVVVHSCKGYLSVVAVKS
ncbi:unnamed protein product [Calypogeia fissa]